MLLDILYVCGALVRDKYSQLRGNRLGATHVMGLSSDPFSRYLGPTAYDTIRAIAHTVQRLPIFCFTEIGQIICQMIMTLTKAKK